jgi:hypothetical protein
LQSESACLAHWIPYLTHRNCQARAQMQRLSHLTHNPAICQEIFYLPLIKHFLQDWKEKELALVMDTSMYWDTYCLIEVCLAWGGRCITLAQTVIKHGSATVGFDQYLPVLEAAKAFIVAAHHGKIRVKLSNFDWLQYEYWLKKEQGIHGLVQQDQVPNCSLGNNTSDQIDEFKIDLKYLDNWENNVKED